jgi:hypothetical protein
MARVLTKLRIDEVSAVDRAAGEGTKIVLMKRAEPHVEEAARASRRAYFLKIFTSKADAADDGDDDAGSLADHLIVELARLLVASGKFSNNADALNYVLNTRHGAALLHRVRIGKDDPPMQDNLAKIAKDIGIVGVAKAIVSEQRNYGISESEFVGLVTAHAAKQHPGLRPDSAFAKLYESEESVRRACGVLKAMPFVADLTPVMVGSPAAMHEAVSDTESSEAYAQLETMAARMRESSSGFSFSADQAFARVFTDPKNAVLAAKAHRRPSPTTSFQFPR